MMNNSKTVCSKSTFYLPGYQFSNLFRGSCCNAVNATWSA